MNFKQIFCKHIWKIENQEYLKSTEIPICIGSMVDIEIYDCYAVYYNCVKCGKQKVKELKRIRHGTD